MSNRLDELKKQGLISDKSLKTFEERLEKRKATIEERAKAAIREAKELLGVFVL